MMFENEDLNTFVHRATKWFMNGLATAVYMICLIVLIAFVIGGISAIFKGGSVAWPVAKIWLAICGCIPWIVITGEAVAQRYNKIF